MCNRHRAIHRTGATVGLARKGTFVLAGGGFVRKRTGLRDALYGRVCEKCFAVFRGVVGPRGCLERYLGRRGSARVPGTEAIDSSADRYLYWQERIRTSALAAIGILPGGLRFDRKCTGNAGTRRECGFNVDSSNAGGWDEVRR
jgi:hypothetical protein